MIDFPFDFHFLSFMIRNLLLVEGDEGLRMNLRKAATVCNVFVEGEREGLGADMRLGLEEMKEAFEATHSEWQEDRRQTLIDVCALSSAKYLDRYEADERTAWKRFLGLLIFRCQDEFIRILDCDPTGDSLRIEAAIEYLYQEMKLVGEYPNRHRFNFRLNLILDMARKIDNERV